MLDLGFLELHEQEKTAQDLEENFEDYIGYLKHINKRLKYSLSVIMTTC